jgi:hypothetical protein
MNEQDVSQNHAATYNAGNSWEIRQLSLHDALLMNILFLPWFNQDIKEKKD